LSQRSEQTEQATVNFAAAKALWNAHMGQLEAAMISGPRDQVEIARLGLMAAAEAVADRLSELVWQQLIDQGIDPRKRLA
jgi:predicted regulator of Ras-like GTPase activity (Roadblock/LC7/MglB family)